MDPKLSGLDPKLQDAYKRVMSDGSSGATTPQNATPAQNSPTPPPENPDPNLNPNPIAEPASPPPQQDPTPAPSPTPEPPVATPTSTPPPSPDPTAGGQPAQNQNPAPPPQTPEQPQETLKVNNAPSEQKPVPNPAPVPSAGSTVAFNATDGSKNVGTSSVKKGGFGGMLPVLVGIGIVFLLVAYTVVWVLIFNIEVPFVSDFI